MNEQELEIAKTIAEIEKIDINIYNKKLLPTYTQRNLLNKQVTGDKYNPFDWSVLGLLMVKHKVEILYAEGYVAILDGYGEDLFWEFFEDENDIPRAILKCIITSQDDLTGYGYYK